MDSQDTSGQLEGIRVAMIGYGAQGRAQALNLRDSGVDVTIGLRENGSTWNLATSDGWAPVPMQQAIAQSDVLCMMVPDMIQPRIYRDLIQDHAPLGATLLFAHGFCIHYESIQPREDLHVVMVSPKGVGAMVRQQFEQGNGVPALVAVHQDPGGGSHQIAMEYARAIGSARAGIYETTFGEETEADLFSEQAILCGGIPSLIQAGWETLVDAGYQPEIAYFECLHEVKLIVDLLYQGGLSQMYQSISDTAAYGGLTAGPRVVQDDVKLRLKDLLKEIQDGRFAKQWQNEHEQGGANYQALVDQETSHPMEATGRQVRRQFAWLQQKNS